MDHIDALGITSPNILASLFENFKWEIGQEVFISFSSKKYILFDKESGENLLMGGLEINS